VLLQRGIELRKAGRDQQALVEFQRAYARGGSVRALVQQALAEQALGLWREAHEHLQEALRKSHDPWIAEHRATLEAASSEIRSQLGSLEISCNIDGAEVRLDGALLGRTPLAQPVPLVAGANVIVVSKLGYFDIVRQVNVDVGRLSRLNVVLTANPGTAAPASAGSARARAGVSPALGTAVPSRGEGAAGGSLRDIFLYSSLGLSALGVSLGVTGYVLREINVAQYNEDTRCSRVDGIRRSDECPEQAAAYQRGEALAIAGFSGGAVFGATALYLWLTQPNAPAEEGALLCLPDGLGLACSGRF
jgi:hypothetical protein